MKNQSVTARLQRALERINHRRWLQSKVDKLRAIHLKKVYDLAKFGGIKFSLNQSIIDEILGF